MDFKKLDDLHNKAVDVKKYDLGCMAARRFLQEYRRQRMETTKSLEQVNDESNMYLTLLQQISTVDQYAKSHVKIGGDMISKMETDLRQLELRIKSLEDRPIDSPAKDCLKDNDTTPVVADKQCYSCGMDLTPMHRAFSILCREFGDALQSSRGVLCGHCLNRLNLKKIGTN